MKQNSRHVQRKLQRVIRRTHLYLGLTLIPWVLLYGVTALLFNHGAWFTGREYVSIGPTPIPLFPLAEQSAKDAVASLNVPNLSYVNDSAQWIGPLRFRGESESANVRLSLHPLGYGGLARTFPKTGEGPEWAASSIDWSGVDEETSQQWVDTANQVLSVTHPEVENLKLRSTPKLRFQLSDGSETYSVSLALDGAMDVAEGEGTAPLRNRLLRLHVQHGDPGYTGVRWVWARLVDIMGCTMILWAITGTLMWWTLRTTRRNGAVALGVGVGLFSILAYSVWHILGLS